MKDDTENKSRMSFINRPPLFLNKPDLELNKESYLDFSPTKVRKSYIVKGTHNRNHTSVGNSFLKDSAQTSYLTTQNTPVHSFIKLSSCKQDKNQKTETDVEEFSKDLELNPRKESYIEKFSPKKRRSTIDA